MFKQRVVVIGELLEHVEPFARFPFGQFGGNGNLLGRLARLVMIGAFESEIDKAGHGITIANGNLPGDQRRGAQWLERFEQVADPALCRIDLVDEDCVRQAQRFNALERRLDQHSARGIGIDHDDCDIGLFERSQPVSGETHGTRGIDDGELVPKIIESEQVELSGGAPCSRLRAGISHTCSGFHCSLARNRAARKKQRLGQTCLSGPGWPNQGHRSYAVDCTRHDPPPYSHKGAPGRYAPRRKEDIRRLFLVSRKCRIATVPSRNA